MACEQSIFLRNISAGTLDIVNFQETDSVYLAFLQKEGEKIKPMGKKSRSKKERKQEKLVVFICTANACRSPMAEKLFEEAVAKSGTKKKIRVFSAGISAMDGDQASENSIIASSEVGLDLSDHRVRPHPATIENASVIFA